MHTVQTHILSHQIHEISINPRHPSISIDDLTMMFEIDAVLGRRDDLRRRLQKALDDAYVQGMRFQTHAQMMTTRASER